MVNKEKLTQEFRQLSSILNPNPSGGMELNFPVIKGDKTNLRSHRMMLLGNESGEHKDCYYASDENQYFLAEIPRIKKKIQTLEKQFRNFQQEQLNKGFKLPEKWPSELQEERVRWEAHLEVATEELEFIDGLIREAGLAKDQQEKEPCLGHISTWGRQQMHDGILVSVAGQIVKPDDDGVLCIDDERSPYNGIPVWRWRSEIYKPSRREHSYRERQELKKPLDERKRVKWPPAPEYEPKTDKISYTGYAEGPLKNLGLK